MSFLHNFWARVGRPPVLAGLAGVLVLYGAWLYGLSTNPPGFYIDETCIGYNGYLIATTGAQEDGTKFPLFIRCYTQGWSGHMSAAQPYAMAVLWLFFTPNVLLARIYAATWIFVAILLLGWLAKRISGRWSVGIIVALTGMVTPWLFEYSRLVMETFVLIFSFILFLSILFNAYKKEKWTNVDVVAIALSLSLITYSYAAGRLAGPLFALGLLFFATSARAFFNVFKVWVIFGLTLIPMLIVYLKEPLVITARFLRATELSKTNSIFQNVGIVAKGLYQDLSLNFFVFEGDRLLRHHVPNSGAGEILIATFALGLLGIAIVLIRHRSDAWWRFILYGLLASMIPGAITFERNHSMRDVAFPVFFLLLTVPAISWLSGLYEARRSASEHLRSGFFGSATDHYLRRGVFAVLMLLTLVQAVRFQIGFRTNGVSEERKAVFHEGYLPVLERALQEESRPIYLHDYGEPVYLHAYWYGATLGVDGSNFIHLLDRQTAPQGALVITSKGSCTECQVIYQNGGFLLYRNEQPDSSSVVPPVPASSNKAPSVFTGGMGEEPGLMSRPRGIAVDSKGNIYVADSGNARIQKFDPDGKFLIEFGKDGPVENQLKEPYGVAVDNEGTIYIADRSLHRLIKFNSDGTFAHGYEGPDTGFYGPHDVAIGSNGQVYVVDGGRSRIARFQPSSGSYTLTIGGPGSGDGQFKDMTSFGVGDNEIFQADLGNGRVEVFDLDGKFIRQWPVPAWEKTSDEDPDVAFDEQTKTVYVTSPKTNEVLAFDINGNPLPGLKASADEEFIGPTSLAIAEVKKKRWLYVLCEPGPRIVRFELEGPKLEGSKKRK